jgi:hypothetical protein
VTGVLRPTPHSALDGAGLAAVPARLSEVLGGTRDLPATAPAS